MIELNPIDEFLGTIKREPFESKRLDNFFWINERDILFELLFPILFKAAISGAQDALEELTTIGIGVDWGLVNEAVRDWAKRYTYDLVSGITETSKKFLQEAEAEWIESGAPLDVLIDQITPMFGSVRAEMIAVTETTRVFAAGNLATWRTSGVVKKKKWYTAEDELVCPICGPLADTEPIGIDDSWLTPDGPVDGPPAHVRCRCWVQPVVEVE